jgi:ribonuclease HI
VKIVIHSDGNKDAGAAVAYNTSGVKVAERARIVRDGTVPICEYTGLIVGLRLAVDLGADEVECWMDAELVAHHVNRVYECKKDSLRPYLSQVDELLLLFSVAKVKLFPKAGPRHKRRFLNAKADRLAAECSKAGHNIDRIHYEIAR